MKHVQAIAALFVAAFSTIAFAVVGTVDSRSSSVDITFTQMGVPVDAKFTRFNGSVDYDPSNSAAARAQLTVDVASFDIGDPMYNTEVLKKEWFNAAQYPRATFTSTAIKPLSADTLQVQGRLEIKGRALDVSVPVKIASKGDVRIFSGTLPIKRLYFNIGEGEWKATDMLADAVTIRFSIATAKN